MERVRNAHGKFTSKPDRLRLGKAYSFRFLQILDRDLAELAELSGISKTEYIRAALQEAIVAKKLFPKEAPEVPLD